MKYKLGSAGCLIVAIVAFGGCYVFQFGPSKLKMGEERLLCSIVLSNQSKLFAIEERDGNFLEPYAVTLYRLDTDKKVFICFLGDEYNHWWGCKLLPAQHSDSVELRAFGMTQGYYSVSNGFTWTVGRRSVSPNYPMDGVTVKEPIPKLVLPDGN